MKAIWIRKTGMLSIAVLLLLGASASASVEPVWRKNLNHTIEWCVLTPVGTVVVGTDEALLGLEQATGEISWQLGNLGKLKPEFFDVIPLTQHALVNVPEGFRGQEGGR